MLKNFFNGIVPDNHFKNKMQSKIRFKIACKNALFKFVLNAFLMHFKNGQIMEVRVTRKIKNCLLSFDIYSIEILFI